MFGRSAAVGDRVCNYECACIRVCVSTVRQCSLTRPQYVNFSKLKLHGSYVDLDCCEASIDVQKSQALRLSAQDNSCLMSINCITMIAADEWRQDELYAIGRDCIILLSGVFNMD